MTMIYKLNFNATNYQTKENWQKGSKKNIMLQNAHILLQMCKKFEIHNFVIFITHGFKK